MTGFVSSKDKKLKGIYFYLEHRKKLIATR